MTDNIPRLLGAGAVGALVAVALSYGKRVLAGGTWWLLGDVTLGTLASIATVFSALCVLASVAPGLMRSVRRGKLLLLLTGLLGLVAFCVLRWATTTTGKSMPAVVPLTAEVLVLVLGWGSAFLVALPFALWVGGARQPAADR